jgi:hypothetical protein
MKIIFFFSILNFKLLEILILKIKLIYYSFDFNYFIIFIFLEYVASSPDEKALIYFAKECGFIYKGLDENGF